MKCIENRSVPSILESGRKRIKITADLFREPIPKAVQDGQDAGFLKGDNRHLLINENLQPPHIRHQIQPTQIFLNTQTWTHNWQRGNQF